MMPTRICNRRPWLTPLAAAISAAALFLITLAWDRIYPFGNASILFADLRYQYADFLVWFQRVLHGEVPIDYSFGSGMGTNTWGLYSYYLASPFNLLLLLFSWKSLDAAIVLITSLKIAAIAAAAAAYLRARFNLSTFPVIVLALSWTFSSWVVTNLHNILWLDAVVLLPLLAWATSTFVRTGRYLPLVITAASAVITCWYTGYILLLFLPFYTLLEIQSARSDGYAISVRRLGRLTMQYVVVMMLAVGLASWTFIPTLKAMLNGPEGIPLAPDLTTTSLRRVIAGFLPATDITPGGYTSVIATPQLYTGCLLMACALAFFFRRSIGRRERVSLFLLMLFTLASVYLRPLQYVWSGFREPNGFYSRTAFLVSFVMLWAAARFLSSFTHRSQDGLIATRWASRWRRGLAVVACAAIAGFTVLDLGTNAAVSWRESYLTGTQANEYLDYARATRSDLDRLVASEGLRNHEFARIDKTYTRAGQAALNEGMSVGYNALSTYASSANQNAVRFLNAMGYSHEGEFSTRYTDANPVMDSLLGVRYIESMTPINAYEPVATAIDDGSRHWYRNQNALSLGFVTPSVPSSEEYAQLISSHPQNPFERQNSFISALVGDDVELFTPLNSSVAADSSGTRTWTVDAPPSTLPFVYEVVPDGTWDYAKSLMRINGGSLFEEGWRFAHSVHALGPSQGAPSTYTATLDASYEASTHGDLLLYGLDNEVYTQTFDQFRTRQFVPERFSQGAFHGAVDAGSGGYLVLSVPMDEGWRYTVDGASVVPVSVADGALTALPLTAGVHALEAHYAAPGRVAGGIVSVATLTCIVVFEVLRRRSRDRACG